MSENILQKLNFHPATVQWFGQQFQNPSPPQIMGWPHIAAGQHTLILAPTGSGKTLAAFLWCIDDLLRQGLKTDPVAFAANSLGVHTLYISPLKALNNDIYYNLKAPLSGIKHTARQLGFEPPHIHSAVRTGDTPAHVRQSMVKKPPHILITTPESLYLLLTSEKGRLIFRNLKYIIVDEIHAVSNNKRGVHLSLSLERLMSLLDNEPIRIGLSATQKPLQRIAAFLGGQTFNPRIQQYRARPIVIVDTGQRKNINLRVISPVKDWTDVPDASVWPLVIDKIYELITSHKNTLVFVNMRAQAEKIARQLNEKHCETTGNSDAELALAHHGSISRELRYETEARLKAGDIPAVIATASLELGIDIGSIDLVVQLQSPGSVSSGLQRVGRSGHLLNSTSTGRIIPLFQADVDDCLALAQAMHDRDIEETTIPENALDVLAQQIVAEVSMRDWPRLELYHLLRGSYCYRTLSETAFNNVVDMLSGRYGDSELRALRPRISWDRVNDKLIARRGSRLLSVLNGGTIADRGYYGVYLEGANTRLGEVEEEFVFESRVGDIFFLGNNEWRINEITRDRILVTPRGSAKPRAPFWKGEPVYRDFATSRKIGAFRKRMLDENQQTKIDCSLANKDTLNSLHHFLERQRHMTRQVPTDHDIVVEYFRDANNEPHIMVHAPFGGRLLGAWATALSTALEKRANTEVQFVYDNDGMLFRLLDAEDLPLIDDLFALSFNDIQEMLISAISQTPMFIVRFRHNATRALLLSRSRTNKRIPLWLQRLRAADLLQVVRAHADFPVLLETYRDCLEDMFDIHSLKNVLEEIQTGMTKIHYAHTTSPSPMAAGLMFRFLAEHMYDYDRFRTTAHAAEISSELLADILAREEIPQIVTQEQVERAEHYWQFLQADRQARDSEDCFEMIDTLGPISEHDLTERSLIHPAAWLNELALKKRIINTKAGWISSATQEIYNSADHTALVRRVLRVRGPQTAEQIATAVDIPVEKTKEILLFLHSEKEIVRGPLIVGMEVEQWCDRDNFALLYRHAIATRRKAHDPGDRQSFLHFLMLWHHTDKSHKSSEAIVHQYAGLYFPLYFFERHILTSRLSFIEDDTIHIALQELIAAGEIIPTAAKTDAGHFYVRFNMRGQEHFFRSQTELAEPVTSLAEDAKIVYQFLKENGASPFRDIRDGTGYLPTQIEHALTILARLGLVSCDHLPTFYAVLQNEPQPSSPKSSWHNQIKQPWSTSQAARRRPLPRREVQARLQQRTGRWFLTLSFAVMGKDIQPDKRAEIQARLLLQRYGILVKEFYRREQGLLSWHQIFQVLKRLEWGGEIRRGYFISGLSGVQFATHEALQLLEKTNAQTSRSQTAKLLSVIDPALPFGGQLEWDLTDKNRQKIKVTRAGSNHIFFDGAKPLLYLENYGSRIYTTHAARPEQCVGFPDELKNWLRVPESIRPRKKIEILQIDGMNPARHELAALIIDKGFEIDGENLVLWPSNL
ncbi:DEAD/DEAH box helicase [candidate division KSB1 bacterium]|nr:DEAD/DEAH box helicase [candidate division KSB1 bacterium]